MGELSRAELAELVAEVIKALPPSHPVHPQPHVCTLKDEELQTIRDFCKTFAWIKESAVKSVIGAVIIFLLTALGYGILTLASIKKPFV